MDIRLNDLNKTIVNCKKCPRLVKFIRKVSSIKRKQNRDEVYWGKPVPGFGDLSSKIAIIGLAPAAHGGTRTGRAFTGDKSGDFLFKCLHKVGISNSPLSKNLEDNLKLKSTYVTNILKCVPPEDKFNIEQKFIFKHNKIHKLPNGLIILSSYHPSPRNVNTKLISEKMMIKLFKKAKRLATS